MPFVSATREDGATLLINLDRIQYVDFRDSPPSAEARRRLLAVWGVS